jgi:hypothetical protein
MQFVDISERWPDLGFPAQIVDLLEHGKSVRFPQSREEVLSMAMGEQSDGLFEKRSLLLRTFSTMGTLSGSRTSSGGSAPFSRRRQRLVSFSRGLTSCSGYVERMTSVRLHNSKCI